MIKKLFPLDTCHTSKDNYYNSNAETNFASTEKQSVSLDAFVNEALQKSWQLFNTYK